MTRARQPGPPLAKFLTRRLLLVACAVFVLNAVAVGVYYGSDVPALQKEVVNHQIDLIAEALDGSVLPPDARLRQLYADHPQAYGFALVDRGGLMLDAMNRSLIPPGAVQIYADDWITRLERPSSSLIVGGSELIGRTDGLRVVFVMQDDPARLLFRVYLAELYEHVLIPILPLVLALLGVNTLLVRRGLAPIAKMAAWARALRPGTPTPPPEVKVPAEISDLVDAAQRSVERLTRALEAEQRHAAEAAHALRTPVAVLSARLDALPRDGTAERLRSDVAVLSRTVQQVLASSRADTLSSDPASRADLSALAANVTAALAPFAYERGVDLALIDAAEPVLACADPEGVELALTNLVENAIVHGAGGSVTVAVGPGPTLCVRDNGPGLPETEQAEHMFQPFWRGRSAPAGGAGLGLAIVARVQKAQNGSIHAENAPEGGAVFTLRYLAVKN